MPAGTREEAYKNQLLFQAESLCLNCDCSSEGFAGVTNAIARIDGGYGWVAQSPHAGTSCAAWVRERPV